MQNSSSNHEHLQDNQTSYELAEFCIRYTG